LNEEERSFLRSDLRFEFKIEIEKMQVLIADKLNSQAETACRRSAAKFPFQPDLKDDTLVAAIGTEKPDVLVVRGTKVTEQMLAAGPLKLIVRAGAGYNTIDVAAASRRGFMFRIAREKTRSQWPSWRSP